jgi:hypothetical protein
MGGCAAGLMFGHPTIESPQGVDPEELIHHLVKHGFKGVPGLRFGVLVGSKLLA